MQEPTASPPSERPPEPEPEPEEQGIPIDVFLAQLTPRAWVTPTLAALILAGFGIEIALGAPPFDPTGAQLLAAGGDFGPSFLAGQWWRALTAMFLHGGLLHLAFNLWAFLSVGVVTERIFGNRAFIAIYFLSGLAASLVSLAWNPLVVGVGASGAIFGVYGALLSFALLHQGVLPTEYLKHQRNSLVGFLGFNVVFALSQKRQHIDMAAHVGGLLMGMAAGALLTRDLLDPAAHAARRSYRTVALAGVLMLAVLAVRHRIANVPAIKARRLADSAYVHLEKKELREAIALYSEAIALVPDTAWLTNRGFAYLRTDQLELAKKDLLQAEAIGTAREARALLCDVSTRMMGDAASVESAIGVCSAAIAQDPKNAELLGLRARLRQEQERYPEAVEDATTALVHDPDHAFARAIRVGARVALGQLDAAEQDCVYLLKPATPRLFDLRICARVAGKRKDAAVERIRLDALLAKEPSDVTGLVSRALLNQQEGRHAESVADYDKAILAKPDLAASWNNRAWAKVSLGEFAAALTDADHAISLAPDDGFAYGTRCFALVGLGELARARNDCVRAVELHPDGQIDRGMLSFIDKQYAAARRDWEAASASDPSAAADLRPWLAKLPR